LNVKADNFREKVTKLADWTNTLTELGLVVVATGAGLEAGLMAPGGSLPRGSIVSTA
jgi:hypothetical protein